MNQSYSSSDILAIVVVMLTSYKYNQPAAIRAMVDQLLFAYVHNPKEYQTAIDMISDLIKSISQTPEPKRFISGKD